MGRVQTAKLDVGRLVVKAVLLAFAAASEASVAALDVESLRKEVAEVADWGEAIPVVPVEGIGREAEGRVLVPIVLQALCS